MTTLERIAQLLVRDFDLKPEALAASATLESLEIDSLRMIEILFSIEDEFKITVPNEQAEIRARVQTLGDLAGFIDELATQQGKA
jgi:acyl carrier protein